MDCILTFFGYGMQNVWWFWAWIVISIAGVYGGIVVRNSWAYLLCHSAAIGMGLYYFRLNGEKLWHMNYDKVGLLMLLVGLFMYVYIITFMYIMAKEHLKNIVEITEYPVSSIISVILGMGWALLLLNAGMCFLQEHPFISLFLVMGMMKSDAHTPTIYVANEGYITGHGYHGGDRFHGDNGNHYKYDGNYWHRM